MRYDTREGVRPDSLFVRANALSRVNHAVFRGDGSRVELFATGSPRSREEIVEWRASFILTALGIGECDRDGRADVFHAAQGH